MRDQREESISHQKLRRAPLDTPADVCDGGVKSMMMLMEASEHMEDSTVAANVKQILQNWSLLPEATKSHLHKLINRASHTHSQAPIAPLGDYDCVAHALPRAPENVFAFRCSETDEILGWRNVYSHPVEYDVELCNGLLDVDNEVLATRMLPEGGPKRRFVVIDEEVYRLYGRRLDAYFEYHSTEVKYVVLPGEESNKRWEAVDEILEQLCIFGLMRREPIIAMGGGVLLDIVGLAANLYRRGVPYIRVPTTLLALVDASVGVKNGIDWCCRAKGPQKNRVGSFYAPVGAFLDTSFIATQNARNVVNGLGEIMKLALVRSDLLFGLLEKHGARLVEQRFNAAPSCSASTISVSSSSSSLESYAASMLSGCSSIGSSSCSSECSGAGSGGGHSHSHAFAVEDSEEEEEEVDTDDKIGQQVIELAIQIMLEELGPNLWEHNLERCVDYGHTFSKIIEMAPGTTEIMHGEAVNVDGFLCVILARRRGMIDQQIQDRIFAAMKSIGLPTIHESCTLEFMVQGLADAVEHRHGEQRIPLLTGVGSSVCVNDITPEELSPALAELWSLHPDFPKKPVHARPAPCRMSRKVSLGSIV